MKKRLVFCFDGTWNRLSADNPTNVVLLAQMVQPIDSRGIAQTVYYDEGIGTSSWYIKRLWQGAFGKGMLGILRDAYRFLIFNYSPGDEIFIFGFSRGAFTARSFAGFIRHAGILDVASATQIDKAIELYRNAPAGQTGQELPEALEFRKVHCKGVCVSEDDHAYRQQVDEKFDPATPLLDIRYLGVWDTVRALGVPDFIPFSGYFNRKYGYHNAILTSKIRSARHAVALDERRLTFPPMLFGRAKVEELNAKADKEREEPVTEWTLPYQEQWFPGVHGAIGGGGALRGLSDAALHWVLSGARRAGLQLRGSVDSVAFAIRPDPFDAIFNDPPGWLKRLQGWWHDLLRIGRKGPAKGEEISLCAYRRWHDGNAAVRYAPRSLSGVADALRNWRYASPYEHRTGMPVLEEYELGPRDTLGSLARERMGDPGHWRDLFEYNRDRIDDPDYLPTSITLRIPPAPEPD